MEKMKLFSEFVAADAEANTPVIKKVVEDPMKKPLHFKYYDNDGEEDKLTEDDADSILGSASQLLTKNKKEMKYESSDLEQGITPLKPVDYTKSLIDVNKLIEPLAPISVSESEDKKEESETVELTV